jgi:hypothetical protein
MSMEGLNNELPKMDKEKYAAVPQETIDGIVALVKDKFPGASEDEQAMVNIIVAKLPEIVAEAKAKREAVKTVH